ncbi:methionine--tRNA ligase [Candidatus Bathyarchaeota archaeon]|nr:MAG: methionine--tRNA ligase [Candidatus Bathyarchaeota archaeon]
MGRWVVCAGWPYVNDRPHLGTFTQLLSADVYARYLRLKGEDVVLVSGSDEHGAPIEVEALRRGIPPKELTNRNHRLIKRLLTAFDVRFDNYTRTESPVHRKFVRGFYREVERKGFVYSRTLTLPYCIRDKRFLPDRFVEGECPYCHASGARGDQCDNCGRVLDPTDLIKPYCVLCHDTPVPRESKHWFFDLPKLSNHLKEYIQRNPNFPENARNFSLAWIKEGLKPRSLTRDISWGIPAPFAGAEGKTIYVWMEAVLGYVSATKEWAEKRRRPNLWRKYWQQETSKNVHFIGKDNIPFHTIILPGLLESTGDHYSLPWQVSSTEYIQFEGQKFSKSRRIGIYLDEAIELEGAEYWRYALISLRPEAKDLNFTWEEFERKINTELNDVLGNFAHRTLSFVRTHFKARVPQYDTNRTSEDGVLATLERAPESVEKRLEAFRLKEGLEQVLELAREGNRYLNQKEPWRVYKTDQRAAGQSLGISIQILATIAIVLQPFLPASANKISRSISGVAPAVWAKAGRCFVRPGTRIGNISPLFHKVSAKELRTRIEEIRNNRPLEAQA